MGEFVKDLLCNQLQSSKIPLEAFVFKNLTKSKASASIKRVALSLLSIHTPFSVKYLFNTLLFIKYFFDPVSVVVII
jgi:hypothetical protein